MRNGQLTETPDGRVFDDYGHEVYYNFFYQTWLWKNADLTVNFKNVNSELHKLLFEE